MNTTTEKQTIKVYPGFKLNDCDRKCESSPKIGSSWWKQYGYNSACLCLEDKINLDYYKNHWEFCLQGLPDDSVSNMEIYSKAGLDFMAKSFVKPSDSKTGYNLVLANHSDSDEDLDICGETGREFDLRNPVKGCGKTITDDDENIMIGNISFCCKCGE